MSKLLNVYKPMGLTPLEMIILIRAKYPELKKEKIGFAGRLDPLAQGVLLLMVGSETTKQKDQFLNLPKMYEFETVFGMATDTYDALGMLQKPNILANIEKQSLKTKIQEFIQSKLGKQIQSYPPFSSKTVNGKPLFWWIKNNKLAAIKIPTQKIEIYSFDLIKTSQLSSKQLKNKIFKQIKSVKGDFRQEKIKEKWTDFFAIHQNQIFSTARFSINCSSGTYIRSITNELGGKLDTGAITIEIKRTKVGKFALKDSLILQK
ncbi:MAG TPA: hypothetical protein VF810_04215 [Patescibacteria group bacterium]